MLVVVLLALRRAFVARAGAELEHFDEQAFVMAGPPQAQARRRLADVRAVAAQADALGHVHVLGGAGVGAAEAHLGAIHGVMDGIAERLVDVARLHDVGVERNHLANGHGISLFAPP